MDEKQWQEEPIKAFAFGVKCGMDRWDVLSLAVSEGWGGSNGNQKKKQLIDEVVAQFVKGKGKVHEDEVQDLLGDSLSNDFNAEAEDGSIQWLSKLFATLWVDCMDKKDFSGLAKMAGTQVQVTQAERMDDSDDSDEGDSEEDEHTSLPQRMEEMTMVEEETPGQSSANDGDNEVEEKQGPQVDEDGFETVTRRKGGGRRGKK